MFPLLHRDVFILRTRADLDAETLADLWIASWRDAMPEIDFPARRDWFLDHLRRLEAAGAVTICAFEGSSRLIGFMILDPETGLLDQLAVVPRAKGSGAAVLLLNEARRLSPEGIRLDVNVDNPRALRFYEREGFERIGDGVNAKSGLETWRLRWKK